MQYSRDDLYATKIGVLQKYARAIGVKAPTKLNKRELIQEIVLIQDGKKLPCVPSTRGRPVKNSGEPISIKTQNKTIKKTVTLDPVAIKESVKKECIARILSEIERKLNNIL